MARGCREGGQSVARALRENGEGWRIEGGESGERARGNRVGETEGRMKRGRLAPGGK